MLHKMVFTITALIITLAGSSEAANFSSWLKDWHIQLNVGKATHFSLPAQPIELFYLQKRTTAHTKPINNNNDGVKLALTADIPLMQTDKFNLGLHSGYERQSTINALEYGGYLSVPAGKLTANAWLGAKTYHINAYDRPGDLLYGCNGVTALAWGVGARTHTSDDWNWQVSIESAGPTHTNNLTYESQNRTMSPAIGSTIPTLTIDRNTTLLVGLGIDVSLFSTVAAQRRARAEAEQQQLLVNITPTYMPFAKAYISNSNSGFRTSMSDIRWNANTQQLAITMGINQQYQRDTTFSDWAQENKALDSLYPPFQADVLSTLTAQLERTVKQAQQEGAMIPTKVLFSLDFNSYQQQNSTTSRQLVGGRIVTVQVEGAQADVKPHRAFVEVTIDPSTRPMIQVQSTRTQIVM